MSRFWKKFLREGQGLFARGAAPRISLGAFGKHPGWDDHIDDIGLETESLLLAKQILYVDGIGGQVNSGEWERLDEAKRLKEFKHVFLWKRGEAFLLGRIWSSRDGKNRTKYPLVVCAHCVGVPFDWALIEVLACLDEVERQCKGVKFADDVRGVLSRALSQLRVSAANCNGEELRGDLDAQTFAGCLGWDENQERLYRVIYSVHTQLAGYMAGAGARSAGDSRAGQVRLPAVAGPAARNLNFWRRFLESQLERNVPLLLTLPLQESWLDATCGEPGTREFYSLRAMPGVLAVSSDVAYVIPDDFRRAQRDLVRATIARSVVSSDQPVSKKWFA